jgi:threonine dehydrogenase-like Zn-dependent dehydrogenase
MMKVLDIQFNMSSGYHAWNVAISLMSSGKLKVSPLISVRNLKEWEKAFKDIAKGKAMKILLTPEGIERKACNGY